MATPQTRDLTFTILSGASLSDAQQLNGGFLEGFIMPAGWTAAALSFAVGMTETGTFYSLLDSAGNEIAFPAAALVTNTAYALPVGALRGWPWIKFRSGLSGAGVNQGADRSLAAIVRFYA